MELQETNLKLNQLIYVYSTYKYDSFFRIDLARIDDVKIVNGKQIIDLQGNDWGACPSRVRKEVYINGNEALNNLIITINERWPIKQQEQVNTSLKDKNFAFLFNDKDSYIEILTGSCIEIVSSLKEGNYRTYSFNNTGGAIRTKIKVDSVTPPDILFSIEDLKEKLKITVNERLGII